MEALFKPSPEQVGKREDEGGDLPGGDWGWSWGGHGMGTLSVTW